jgi:hypothetical protein
MWVSSSDVAIHYPPSHKWSCYHCLSNPCGQVVFYVTLGMFFKCFLQLVCSSSASCSWYVLQVLLAVGMFFKCFLQLVCSSSASCSWYVLQVLLAVEMKAHRRLNPQALWKSGHPSRLSLALVSKLDLADVHAGPMRVAMGTSPVPDRSQVTLTIIRDHLPGEDRRLPALQRPPP